MGIKTKDQKRSLFEKKNHHHIIDQQQRIAFALQHIAPDSYTLDDIENETHLASYNKNSTHLIFPTAGEVHDLILYFDLLQSIV
jgi:hypothetical protein